LEDRTRSQFTIHAHKEPQALARVIGPFAQLGLVPDRVDARAQGDALVVLVIQPGLEPARAEVIAHKLRGQVFVEHVDLTHSRPDLPAPELPCIEDAA
jgi:hypothetical protein